MISGDGTTRKRLGAALVYCTHLVRVRRKLNGFRRKCSRCIATWRYLCMFENGNGCSVEVEVSLNELLTYRGFPRAVAKQGIVFRPEAAERCHRNELADGWLRMLCPLCGWRFANC